MIQRVYEQCEKAKVLSAVVVATDDERIYAHVKSFGGNCTITSPNHQSGTDRCREAAEILGVSEKETIIVNIQGDEPYINPEQIEELVNCFTDSTVKIATLVKKAESIKEVLDPSKPKVVLNKNMEALYFSRSTIPFIRGHQQEDWLENHVFTNTLGYMHTGWAP
jgi:3-deoxy-manno-octulosonate cytidylyltransferase (CMP-KDO synthetase)